MPDEAPRVEITVSERYGSRPIREIPGILRDQFGGLDEITSVSETDNIATVILKGDAGARKFREITEQVRAILSGPYYVNGDPRYLGLHSYGQPR